MRRFLLIAFLFFLFTRVNAQTSQIVSNGTATSPINFPATNCIYNWVNDKPGIGLPASGIGNIPSFTAVNNTGSPVTATITVNPVPVGYAYISNSSDGSMSIVSLLTRSVIGTVKVGQQPYGVWASADGTRVYVVNSSSDNVSVIDTHTNTVIATVKVGKGPLEVTASKDGSHFYVTNQTDSTMTVVNAITYATEATIKVGVNPAGIIVNGDGSRIYVANATSNTISVIDGTANKLLTTLSVGIGPGAMALSPDGSQLYVLNTNDFTISVINTASNTIKSSINISPATLPAGLVLSPDGTRAYISDFLANTVVVVNLQNGTVITRIGVDPGPDGVSVSADGNQLYVCDYSANSLAVISTATNTQIATVPVGTGPFSYGSFVTPGYGCNGSPSTFTITVNPTSASGIINAGAPSGTIITCAGTASASPNVQQITVSATGLSTDVIAKAPAGFEVSIAPGSGYGTIAEISETAGVITNNILYVRASAAAPAGAISGTVALTSGSALQDVIVTGTVNASAAGDGVVSQTLVNGDNTTDINFTGTANTFTWVNDTPGIGLAASGNGNIPSFTAINNSNSPVTATITVVPSNSGFAYVTNTDGTISVVNTATSSVVSSLTLGGSPGAVAVSADGTRAYIANYDLNNVSVINTANNTVISSIPAGLNPVAITISPDGSKLFVSNNGSNTVTVLYTATGTRGPDIPTGNSPYGIVLSPDGLLLYVVNQADNTLTVFNATTYTPVVTIPVGKKPVDVFAAPSGNLVYVTNFDDNTVSVINTASQLVTATLPTGSSPYGLTISPDGSRLYVANEASKSISVFSTSTNNLLSNITVGDQPHGVTIDPDGSRIYVTNSFSNNISIISTATNALIANVPVNTFPVSLGNFVTGGTGCNGPPFQFNITVNPTSLIATIKTSSVSGAIYGCQGIPSSDPNILKFTASGTSLTGDITVTAQAGFEISVALGSGYGSTVTLGQTGGKVATTIIYVRTSAAAQAGDISGTITVTSPGTKSATVTVKARVVPSPLLNPVGNQTVAANSKTTAIAFSGIGDGVLWTNDTPSIGLPAAGTGNIASFIAANNTSNPVTATITAIPVYASYAYIANAASGNVSVINTATDSVLITIGVGSSPYGVTVSPDGSKAYVTTNNDNSLSVINTADNSVVAHITVGSLPTGVAISPDGSVVYVVNNLDHTVSVIDATSNTVTATIPIGLDAYGIAVSPDGSRVYVANGTGSNSVSVIEASNNLVMATVPVGNGPLGITVSPDGKMVYVANAASNSVSVINAATNAVVATITVLKDPRNVAVTPNGALLYVSDSGSNSISVINTATNTLISNILLGTQPFGLSFNPDGSRLYITTVDSDYVLVINTVDNTLIEKILVGLNPNSLGNFITGGASCSGAPINFTITVNPATTPKIIVGAVAGSIVACAGTASASPDISQFTVSGSNLTTGILVTAPAGFEVSLSPGNGYAGSVALAQASGTVNGTIVYFRSSASAAAGNLAGDVTLTSAGASDGSASVTGVVNALPAVNAVANQSVANGSPTTAVAFTGTTDAIFKWVNDTPGIGLAASGIGNIASFTAVNAGSSPVKATITVTPVSAGLAYISNNSANTVSVINTATNTVLYTIAVGSFPAGVAVSPDGTRAYITNILDNTISIINTTTNAVISTIPAGSAPQSLAVTPDGGTLYVTNEITATVSVINLSTNVIIATVPVGAGPKGIAVSPDGKLVYAVCEDASSVSVISAATNKVIATIKTGGNSFGVVFSADGSDAYVTNYSGNSVSVINTASSQVTSSISVGKAPMAITLSPDGSHVYVSNSADNSISEIDVATNKVIATIPITLQPFGVSVSPDGGSLYVADVSSKFVTVINTATNAVVATVEVGLTPGSFGNFITKGTGCDGVPVSFTITVNPTATLPVITASGTLSAVNTIYGTASPSTSFTVSGANILGGIVVTPPPGYQVSTDNINFTNTVTVGSSGPVASTTVYVRLTSATAAGSYSGNVVLSSAGAANVNVPTVSSTVSPAPLTVTANSVNKGYGTALKGGPGSTAFTSTGLQNSENIGSVTITYGTGAAASAPGGTFTGQVVASAASGGTFKASNYNITYLPGDITVGTVTLTITADNKTKIFNGPNPVLTIRYSGFINNDGPAQLTTQPIITTSAVISSPPGQYPITANGAASPTYIFVYVPGILTVEVEAPKIVIPNTFTPNGDGINDTWNIQNLDLYPNCSVQVFSRWGQNVYTSRGYGIPWAGTYNNRALPTGTYYYVIDLKNGSKYLSGFVLIVR